MTYFKYLGRVLTMFDDEFMVVANNLIWARYNWVPLSMILGQ